MPARPSVSRGCHSCRRMKVKCDEARPSCARCTRAGRTCPGYRELDEGIFRSMNSSVAGKIVLSLSKSKPHPKRNNTVSVAPIPRKETVEISRFSTDWKQNSIAHFFENFSFVNAGTEEGYLDFLPHLISQNENSACLQEALIAASTAYLANVSSFHHLETVSRVSYGRALKSVAASLATPDEVNDCTLAAILLIQHYEVFHGEFAPRHAHQAALIEIARTRGVRQFQSAAGSKMFTIIQERSRVMALDGTAPQLIPVEPKFDLRMLRPFPLNDHLWRLLHEASECVSAMKSLVSQLSYTESVIPDLLQGVQTGLFTQARLVGWQNIIPEEWNPKDVAIGSEYGGHLDKTIFPTRLYGFKCIRHAALWICFWCSRMHLLEALIASLDHLPGPQRVNFHCCRKTLRHDLLTVIEDVCASASFMLGDIDENGCLSMSQNCKGLGPFFLLRGIHVANMVEDVPAHIRMWILKCLDRIGHAKGFKLALRSKKMRNSLVGDGLGEHT